MITDATTAEGREQLLDEVLTTYFRALDAGHVPDRRELLARHPQLVTDLERFFEDQDAIGRLTEPLRGLERTLPAGALGTFGDYELLGVLGCGGMGAVYKARQRSLDRLVALKMIRPGGAVGPRDVFRFRAEAEVVAGLVHPNIVPVHEVGEQDGVLYLSMRFVEGGSLAERLDRFTADPRAAVRLVADVARAVHFVHQRGVLHRDLKPANILLDPDGLPLVGDFGLAKRAGGDSGLTQSGTILGTPSYMAPEQASGGKGAVTTAADVYGLGAVLYTLLTGRPPFKGETVLQTLEQVRGCEPVPPDRLNRRVDRDLATMCLKCLEKDPARRYGSAAELAEDLGRWLGGEPVRARPVGRIGRAWRWCRRNPLGAGLLVTAALAVLTVAVSTVLVWREKEETAKALVQQQAALDRAEARTQFAREAAQDLYTDVAEKLLSEQPRMTEVQRRFLLKALRFYEELAREGGAGAAARLEAARAWGRAARIHQALGDDRQAEAAYRQVIARAESATDDPLADQAASAGALARDYTTLATLLMRKGRHAEAEPLIRSALRLCEDRVAKGPSAANVALKANVSVLWGTFLKETGRAGEAEKVLREARRVRWSLAASFPKETSSWLNLNHVSCQLGMLLDEAGRPADAIPAFRECLGALKWAESLSPGSVPRDEMARCFSNLGAVLTEVGQTREAEGFLRQAIDLNNRLAADFPKVPLYRSELANYYDNLGKLLMAEAARRGEAGEAFRQARVIREKLVEELPEEAEYQSDLGGILNNHALLLKDQGGLEEARRLFDEAIRHQQAALKRTPNHPVYRDYLRNHYLGLARTLFRLQQVGRLAPSESKEAVEVARQAVALSPRDAGCRGVLAYAEYRAGNEEGAAAALKQAAQLRGSPSCADVFLRSMIDWRRGEKARAREAFDEAYQWMTENAPRDEELLRLWAEASALLKVTSPRDPPPRGRPAP